MGGKADRDGLFHCPDCRGQFTVRTGHVMERSHVPLTKWVLAFHLMASSKKGISAHQLHRTLRSPTTRLGSWRTASARRCPEERRRRSAAMARSSRRTKLYHGKRETPAPAASPWPRPKPTKRGKGGGARSAPIVAWWSAVARSACIHMNHVTGKNLRELRGRARRSQEPSTHRRKQPVSDTLARTSLQHETSTTVEGICPWRRWSRNTVEGFFGMFKRGMVASTSTAANSTSSAIWTNSASAGTTRASLASRMQSAPHAAVYSCRGQAPYVLADWPEAS